MTPALLLPSGLAALAALAIPLAIHIARRSEERRTDFAALRWLRERPKQLLRMRFDDLLLLALRLALLVLLAIWLAHPILTGSVRSRPWVVAIPGVDPAAAQAVAGEMPLHWLAPGFPEAETIPAGGLVPVGSLLRELDATLPAATTLTVLVPPIIEGADAERPRLSRSVAWKILPGRMAAPPPFKSAPVRLAIRAAPNAPGLRYLRAAALALRPDADIGPLDKALPANGILFWLASEPPPAAVRTWANAGNTVLTTSTVPIDPQAATLLHDKHGAPLVEAINAGRGRILRVIRPLVPATAPELLDPDFAARLGVILLPAPRPPARVAARDYAPVVGGIAPSPPVDELRPWLALLIAAVVLAERWLATSRARHPGP